tara:strand:+ start:87 stop:527 length:441 start_codon:yes stop_codon:yes gene_type:complete
MGTLQVGGTTLGVKNTSTNKIDLSNTGTLDSLPFYACRAWVNFDASKDTSGSTSSSNTNRLILGSGNVTSVYRNAAGDYSINFTTAMPDANYCISVSCADGNTNNNVVVSAINGTNAQTASQARVYAMSEDSGATDPVLVHVAIFR